VSGLLYCSRLKLGFTLPAHRSTMLLIIMIRSYIILTLG